MRGLVILALCTLAGCAPMLRGPAEGCKAPPAAGSADGRPLDLAEYQGKVVLLSFWHSHCPPCRALFPHEKALVARYAGKPFVLLGVNADKRREDAARCRLTSALTWPSYWDGPGGQISEAWKVDRFPTLFLIDAKGTVRYRHAGAPPDGELEAKIDELLRKAGDGYAPGGGPIS